MTSYCNEDAIIDFLISPDDVAEPAAIEAHLASCQSCQETATSYRKFSQSLSSPATWEREEFGAMVARHDESQLQDFLSYTRQIDQEVAASTELVEKLLGLDSIARAELLELSSEYWTVGVTRELCERANGTVEKSPIDALGLSKLAIQVSQKLSPASYHAGTVFHLRGRALKEQALALKFLGRYPEALSSLDQAENTFAKASISEFDLAIVAFLRAMIFRDLQRVSEALVLAQKSAAIFSQFGHQRRFMHARILEAAILYSSGDLRSAKDIWTELLKVAKAENDTRTLASLMNNIGLCLVDLGDSSTAASYLMQAIALFKDLGLTTASLQSHWTLGRMLITSQKYNEGLTRLRSVHEQYELMEMSGEAGLVALDIVEALLATSRAEEAAVICRYLVEQFTRCGMSSNVLTAVSYLREALVSGKASPTLAKHVRNYVAEAPHKQEFVFLPPAE